MLVLVHPATGRVARFGPFSPPGADAEFRAEGFVDADQDGNPLPPPAPASSEPPADDEPPPEVPGPGGVGGRRSGRARSTSTEGA